MGYSSRIRFGKSWRRYADNLPTYISALRQLPGVSQLYEIRLVNHLVRERVGAKLEMQDLARCSFATFRVKRRSRAIGRPKSLSLPASLGIRTGLMERVNVFAKQEYCMEFMET
jgi:hypothetical protein